VTFAAELHLLSTTEGGRETPLASGYRSIVRFGTEDGEPAWGVEITFDTPGSIAPGASAHVRLRSWAWDEFDPAPNAGTRLFLYEARRLVGTGVAR
jgi:translation elongation factor EF-Tu-like GTPase